MVKLSTDGNGLASAGNPAIIDTTPNPEHNVYLRTVVSEE